MTELLERAHAAAEIAYPIDGEDLSPTGRTMRLVLREGYSKAYVQIYESVPTKEQMIQVLLDAGVFAEADDDHVFASKVADAVFDRLYAR